jgi:hypothetical protein
MGERAPCFTHALSTSRMWARLFLVLGTVLFASSALAQGAPETTVAPRNGDILWDANRQAAYTSVEFRDVIDAEVTQKLKRGLPTRILLTALAFANGDPTPVSTTFQSCKITWHVWEDMYRVEVQRPDQPAGIGHWTPTLNGVLRRCATATQLIVADAAQLTGARSLHLDVTIRINPVSEEMLGKLKRWVTHPNRTGTAAPGSALFSTFTGLFMQRMGDAEKTVHFRTFEVVLR